MTNQYIDYRKEAVEVARKKIKNPVNRTEMIHLRVTVAEKAMIKRVAAETGLNVTSFTRDSVLDVARAIIEFNGEEPEA